MATEHAVERLTDAVHKLTECYTDTAAFEETMRDRFALAIVAGWSADYDGADDARYARHVYDLAEALDTERRRRNSEDGR